MVLVCGLIVAVGADLNAYFGLDPNAQGEDLALGLLLFGVIGFPAGAIVGGAGWWLVHKHGGRGAGVFAAMLVLGIASGVIAYFLVHQIPFTPNDIGFVTTSWLWEHAGWKGLILYLLTIVIDIMIMGFALIVGALALAVMAPTSGVCCALSVFAVALPGLAVAAKRRAGE